MLLFVYGTLKRGFCREHYLADQTFVGPVMTEPAYRLLDCGDYPALVDSGDTAVEGELYDVDEQCLVQLDRVEMVDKGLYRRAVVSIARPVVSDPVMSYLYAMPTIGLPELGPAWTKR